MIRTIYIEILLNYTTIYPTLLLCAVRIGFGHLEFCLKLTLLIYRKCTLVKQTQSSHEAQVVFLL